MREMLSTTAALYGQGMGDKVALITDGRFSAHARLLHRPCRAGSGGRRPDRADPATATSSHRRPRKGHAGAQAHLGKLLFEGDGIEANPVEGLMWLTVASRRSANTPDEGWIQAMLNDCVSVATPDQRKHAIELADNLGARFGGL
jgi:hypothetical protein